MIGDDLLTAMMDSPDPLMELRGAIRVLLSQGHERDVLVARLVEFKEMLRCAGRSEPELDPIDDIIAHLIGYCSPHLRL